MSLALDDTRHGTVGGYKYHKCRCQPCRGAYSNASKLYRETSNRERIRKREAARTIRGMGVAENLTPLPGAPYDFSEMIPSCDGYNHYQTDYDA